MGGATFIQGLARMQHAALSLGSNMGDRLANIRQAISLLKEAGIQVVQQSRLYETAPAYVLDQPAFLNMALIAATELQPLPLLRTLKHVEAQLGRQAGGLRWGPRPLDIDIIFYEDWHVEESELQVPHPRWQERSFVKAPLADLEVPANAGGLASRLRHAHRVWLDDGGEQQVGGSGLQCVMPLPHGRGLWAWQQRSLLMAVLNVTPDSFSDGGESFSPDAAVAKAASLVQEGADIIDVGGQSSRPGAMRISPEEELGRVIPVIEALSSNPALASATISVDTFYSDVARQAVNAGAHIVNDVSGGTLDSAMLDVVAALRVPYVLMHMRGDPGTMQARENTTYEDVVVEVGRELSALAEQALAAGIEPSCLVLDPGVGFAKTGRGNCQLIAGLHELRQELPRPVRGCPLLVGPSRKGFLGRITGREAKERDVASGIAAAISLWQGANIIRMHNATVGRDTVSVVDALKRASISTNVP